MKRIIFWLVFVVVLALIIWGLIIAINKPSTNGLPDLGAPAPVTAADHVEGPANAPVTLIEYGDFQCPACAEYSGEIEQLAVDASTTLRIVFRHFPLAQHQNSMIAAQAADSASDQGKFWQMYKLIYDGQTNWENQSYADARKTYDGYAMQLGLNMAKFDQDVDSPAAKQFILGEQSEGQQLGIDYTPTFFINGKVINNPNSYDEFKADITKAAQQG